MKKSIAFFLLAAGLLAAYAAAQNPGDYKTFQLVYSSDTRGYVQPCG